MNGNRGCCTAGHGDTMCISAPNQPGPAPLLLPRVAAAPSCPLQHAIRNHSSLSFNSMNAHDMDMDIHVAMVGLAFMTMMMHRPRWRSSVMPRCIPAPYQPGPAPLLLPRVAAAPSCPLRHSIRNFLDGFRRLPIQCERFARYEGSL